MQLVESARLEERHDLKRLGTGSPGGDEARVVRGGNERIVGAHDRNVHAMPRFDVRATRSDDV
jgi:hypothetical protein